MFGLKKNKKEESKKKSKKEKNLFDEWAKRNKCLALNVSDVTSFSWYNELIKFIEDGGKPEVFLANKNKDIEQEFIEKASERCIAKIEGTQEEIKKCEMVIGYAEDIEDDIVRFQKDVKKLAKIFKKENFEKVKKLLVGYSETAYFDEKDLEALNMKLEGFWNIVFNGIRMWRARRFLRRFVNRYLNNNVSQKAYYIFFRHYGKDLGYVLSLRISTITLFDDVTTKIWVKKKDKMLEKNQRILKKMMEIIVKENKVLEEIKKSFKTAELLKKEEEVVRAFLIERGLIS